MYKVYMTSKQKQGMFMLTPASIEQELNIITTVIYKCCVNHSVLMTSPLITAPADGSHSSLMTAPAV